MRLAIYVVSWSFSLLLPSGTASGYLPEPSGTAAVSYACKWHQLRTALSGLFPLPPTPTHTKNIQNAPEEAGGAKTQKVLPETFWDPSGK